MCSHQFNLNIKYFLEIIEIVKRSEILPHNNHRLVFAVFIWMERGKRKTKRKEGGILKLVGKISTKNRQKLNLKSDRVLEEIMIKKSQLKTPKNRWKNTFRKSILMLEKYK